MGVRKDEVQVDVEINGTKAGKTLSELKRESQQLYREISKLAPGTQEFVNKAAEIRKVESAMKSAKDSIKGINTEMDTASKGFMGKVGNMLKSLGPMAGAMAAMFSVQLIWDFAKSIFNVTAEFQKYEAVLTNTLGSQKQARDAMQVIKDIAASTPFSVAELTESYVKLVNQGLNPTRKEIIAMGDLASSQGKSFDQLTEAVIDAQTGQFERLKEFSIKAQKEGDKVSFSFKNQTTVVDNNSEAIKNYITGLGELKGVAGGMAAVSETLGGKLSNLGDAFDNIMNSIGQGSSGVISGFLDFILDLLANTEPLADVFSHLYELTRSLFSSIGSLLNSLGLMPEKGNAAGVTMKLLASALNLATSGVQLFLTFLQASVDGLNMMINKGKEAANFFGADFKIDPNATFDNLSKNVAKNFNGIKQSWVDIWTDKEVEKAGDFAYEQTNKVVEKSKGLIQKLEEKLKDLKQKQNEALTVGDVKKYGAQIAATQKELDELLGKGTKKPKDTAKKDLEERLKAEAEADKRIQQLRLQLEKDEFIKKQQTAVLNRDLEVDSVNQSLATQAQKAEQIRLIDEKLKADLLEIEKEHQKKEQDLANRAALAYNDMAIIEANQKNSRLANSRNDQALTDALLDKLETQKQIELQNAELTEVDKLLITAKYEAEKDLVREDYAEREKARQQAVVDAAVSLFQGGLQAISDFTQISADRDISQAERVSRQRVAKLDSELKSKKLNEDQYQNAKAAAEAVADQKIRAIKIKQAQIDRKVQLTQALVNTALAVTAGMASPAIPPFPSAIAAGILGAIQIGKIAATPIPTFAHGGIAQGASHAQGGIAMIDSMTGRQVGEMEGGEPYMILSKNTYKNNRDVVNQLLDSSLHRGGAKIKYENGGVIAPGALPNTAAGSAGNDTTGLMLGLLSSIDEKLGNFPTTLKAYVLTQEITDSQALLSEIESDSKFGNS